MQSFYQFLRLPIGPCLLPAAETLLVPYLISPPYLFRMTTDRQGKNKNSKVLSRC